MKFIEDAYKRIDGERDFVKGCEECYHKIKNIVNLEEGNYFSIGLGYGQLNGLLLMLHNQNDLLPVMEIVEKLCIRLNTKVSQISDYPEVSRKSFYLKDTPIIISAFFNGDNGSVCKFVKTGEKREPVYEFICPESI